MISEAAEALIPWLKRLRPQDSTQTLPPSESVGETLPPLAKMLPTYDFLAPPEQPDEHGRLGHYRVLQSIGVGGMGMVFRAEDTRLKRQVALKIVKPELLLRQDLHERFLTEARAIAAVEHDNIVAIYEAGDVSNVPYLVMPLLRGESLEDCLKRREEPLPVDDILRIGREIAGGLEPPISPGLVHRDIKPSNLWLETRGQESEVRSQKSEVRSQKSEVRSQKSEVRSQKSEVSTQEPGIRDQETIVKSQESGIRSQESGNRSAPWTPDSSPLTPGSCPLTPVAGRIKILDFGLARSLDAATDEGDQPTIVGTPSYMSPSKDGACPWTAHRLIQPSVRALSHGDSAHAVSWARHCYHDDERGDR